MSPSSSAARMPPAGFGARAAWFFVAGLTFALTLGSGLGAWLLASRSLPWDLLGGLSPDAIRLMHAHAQVFGFAALFVMGVAYHVVPALRGTTLTAPGVAMASCGLQVLGVVAVAVGALLGPPAGWFVSVGGEALLVAAAAAFAGVMRSTLRAGLATPERIERYLRAGVAWLVLASALGLAGAVRPDAVPRAAIWQAALWGFAGSWIFGMSHRIVPVVLGVATARGTGDTAVFLAYQASAAGWLVAALTGAPLLRGLAGCALACAGAGFVLRLGVLARRPHGAGGPARFIVAAYGWLAVALVLEPAWSAAAAFRGLHAPALVLDLGRHAFTLGFLTQMVMGVAMVVVPVFTGTTLWSAGWREAAFVLLNAAMVTRALQALAEVASVAGVWPWVALSGPLGVAAFAAFTVNVVMTVRSRPPRPPGLAPEGYTHPVAIGLLGGGDSGGGSVSAPR